MSEKGTPEKKHLTPEELQALIAEDGAELTDEDLEQISGGWGDKEKCPPGQHHYEYKGRHPCNGDIYQLWICSKCGDCRLR
jgi:bacteriocin-like protein